MHHRTVQDFFAYEISEMHKNIDRIKHGLAGRSARDDQLAGQHKLLAIQESHLAFIEDLQAVASTYDEAISSCRQYIIHNEIRHSDIASHENPNTPIHSEGWWQTLHDAWFASDFMHRLQAWKKRYTETAC